MHRLLNDIAWFFILFLEDCFKYSTRCWALDRLVVVYNPDQCLFVALMKFCILQHFRSVLNVCQQEELMYFIVFFIFWILNILIVWHYLNDACFSEKMGNIVTVFIIYKVIFCYIFIII